MEPERNKYDAFVGNCFCKRCRKYYLNCLCKDKTLKEIIIKKKELGREYALSSYNLMENYND